MLSIPSLMIAAAIAAQPQPAQPASQPTDGNLLVNGSFEDTIPERPPEVNPHVLGEWWSFAGPKKPYWRHFEIDNETAYDGERSTRLTLDSEGFDGRTLIVGATQNVVTETMPTELSGMVRVEDWQRGTMHQYVQIVVIVWNVTDNMPKGQDAKNYQIAYTFAGIERPPFRIKNRKFLFPRGDLVSLQGSDGDPIEDEWVEFDLNPREDFIKHWGVDPSDYQYIRVLYEVRYDGRDAAKESPASAVVHWDDLYFGPDRDAEAEESGVSE